MQRKGWDAPVEFAQCRARLLAVAMAQHGQQGWTSPLDEVGLEMGFSAQAWPSRFGSPGLSSQECLSRSRSLTMAPQIQLSELGSPDSISQAPFFGLCSLCSPLQALQAWFLGHGLLGMALQAWLPGYGCPGLELQSWLVGGGSPGLAPRVQFFRLSPVGSALQAWLPGGGSPGSTLQVPLSGVSLEAWCLLGGFPGDSPGSALLVPLSGASLEAWCLLGGFPGSSPGGLPGQPSASRGPPLPNRALRRLEIIKCMICLAKLCATTRKWAGVHSPPEDWRQRVPSASFFNASTRDALKLRECSSLKRQLRSKAINLTS